MIGIVRICVPLDVSCSIKAGEAIMNTSNTSHDLDAVLESEYEIKDARLIRELVLYDYCVCS